MTCFVRKMCMEDLSQVADIDREAFPTQWPPPNYKHELQNQLARYVVACDETRTISEPGVNREKGLRSLVTTVRRWFTHDQPHADEPPPSVRQYIVGFAGIWVLADKAHITNIAVRTLYQRRGIGELLLASTIDLAKEMKATAMTLEVRISNTAAQNLYRKYGFIQVELRRAYYTDNREDGVIMSTENITTASFQAQLQQLKEAHSRKWSSRIPST